MSNAWIAVKDFLINEKTSTNVIVQLTMHMLLLYGMSAIVSMKSAQALVVQTGCNTRDRVVYSNPVYGYTCHTIDKCFKKSGGLEEQYSNWCKKG